MSTVWRRQTCQLQLRLSSGSGLVVRDVGGSSDPYVVFQLADRQLGRSRVVRQSLEPVWDEDFQFTLDSPVNGSLELRVYDWDALSPRDDYMGRCLLPLGAMCPGQLHSFRLPLVDETGAAGEVSMGDLRFAACLMPPSPEVESPPPTPLLPSPPPALLLLPPSAVVTVSLVDLVGLEVDDDPTSSVSALAAAATSRPLYAQLRLGDQSCRSSAVRRGHRWDQELHLPMPPPRASQPQQELLLHLAIYERHLTTQDVLIGRTSVPVPVSGTRGGSGSGELLTVPLVDHRSGGAAVRLFISVDDSADGGFDDKKQQDDADNSCDENWDVGSLWVRVLGAEGIRDGIYCTLRLGNLQHRSRISTDAAVAADGAGSGGSWFRFRVLDLHTELELTVYEQARQQRLLGRLSLRLTQLDQKAAGSLVAWYGLRDKRLEQWTGARIRLETQLRVSSLRAALTAIGPPEPRLWGVPDPKFHLRLVRRDVRRCAAAVEAIARLGDFASSCCQWEDPVRSAGALASYLAIVWNLQPCLLPLLPLTVLLCCCVRVRFYADDDVTGAARGAGTQQLDELDEEDAESTADGGGGGCGGGGENGGGRQSLLERARGAQELLLKIQDGLDTAASAFERLHNLCRWTEPRITGLAVVLLAAAALVLGLLPLRLLALAWGLNKFTKRLLRPGADDSNELLNLLGRVPSDVDLERTRLLPPQLPPPPLAGQSAMAD